MPAPSNETYMKCFALSDGRRRRHPALGTSPGAESPPPVARFPTCLLMCIALEEGGSSPSLLSADASLPFAPPMCSGAGPSGWPLRARLRGVAGEPPSGRLICCSGARPRGGDPSRASLHPPLRRPLHTPSPHCPVGEQAAPGSQLSLLSRLETSRPPLILRRSLGPLDD